MSDDHRTRALAEGGNARVLGQLLSPFGVSRIWPPLEVLEVGNGRAILAEMSGGTATQVGPAIDVDAERRVAQTLLTSGGPSTPDIVFRLALALVTSGLRQGEATAAAMELA